MFRKYANQPLYTPNKLFIAFTVSEIDVYGHAISI